MRVLIADDDKCFAEILAELVRSCDHDVVEVVSSGLSAIRSYQQHKPDVVLLDFTMAKLNGLTACRNILSSDPAGRVVFLSGATHAVDLSPAHSGAVAVLQKPIALSQVREVLAGLEEERRPRFQIVAKAC